MRATPGDLRYASVILTLAWWFGPLSPTLHDIWPTLNPGPHLYPLALYAGWRCAARLTERFAPR